MLSLTYFNPETNLLGVNLIDLRIDAKSRPCSETLQGKWTL